MAGIIVVFPKSDDARAIKNLLIRSGYSPVVSCTSGSNAIQMADNLGDGIIISGYRLPDMMYSDIYEYTEGRFEMLLLSSKTREMLEDDTGVAMLQMPLKVQDLLNSVEMMDMNLFERESRTKRVPPKRTPQEQHMVEQAKAVLMEKNHMSENEAHRYIQKSAMDSGRNMVETASMILTIMYKE